MWPQSCASRENCGALLGYVNISTGVQMVEARDWSVGVVAGTSGGYSMESATMSTRQRALSGST